MLKDTVAHRTVFTTLIVGDGKSDGCIQQNERQHLTYDYGQRPGTHYTNSGSSLFATAYPTLPHCEINSIICALVFPLRFTTYI